MITHTTEVDDSAHAEMHSSVMEKCWALYRKLGAQWAEQAGLKSQALAEKEAHLALAKSNRQFEQVEEMKYYLTQRHRAAIGALHGTPKGKLIDKQYFATMQAVAAIEDSSQTTAQKLEHQRIALQYGKRAIKDIIAGRVGLDD